MADHPLPSILHPRRILVRGVNWLGDAVMTTPALQRLRERFPRAHITLLTPEKLGDMWLHHPDVDAVLTFSAHNDPASTIWRVRLARLHVELAASIGQAPTKSATAAEAIAEGLREMNAKRYDVALILPNSPRSALEMALARIPVRIGYARGWRNWLLTHPIPIPASHLPMLKRSVREIRKLIKCPDAEITHHASRFTFHASRITHHSHHIHHYLQLVAALGANPEPVAPRLEVTSTEVQAARAGLAAQIEPLVSRTPSDKPPLFLGINPGAEYGPAKRWPAENFAAVVQKVSEQSKHLYWLVFGGTQDKSVADEIVRLAAGANIINLAGQTSLRQLMALLKLCRVVLTNDTGPMHLAAALGTPVVVPFGSTSPELTGPGLPGDPRHHLIKSAVPCSPCFRRDCPIDLRCMTSITVEQISQAVLNALS